MGSNSVKIVKVKYLDKFVRSFVLSLERLFVLPLVCSYARMGACERAFVPSFCPSRVFSQHRPSTKTFYAKRLVLSQIHSKDKASTGFSVLPCISVRCSALQIILSHLPTSASFTLCRIFIIPFAPVCEIVMVHFRITFSLFLKASLGAHPFKGKCEFIHMQIKLMTDCEPRLALIERPVAAEMGY